MITIIFVLIGMFYMYMYIYSCFQKDFHLHFLSTEVNTLNWSWMRDCFPCKVWFLVRVYVRYSIKYR
jgi:hypothetical protein